MPPISCTSKCRMLQRALAGLADHRERLGQHRVERLAVGDARLELGGLGRERLVGERRNRGLERVDLARRPGRTA